MLLIWGEEGGIGNDGKFMQASASSDIYGNCRKVFNSYNSGILAYPVLGFSEICLFNNAEKNIQINNDRRFDKVRK